MTLSDKTAEYWIFVRFSPECDPDLNAGWSVKRVRFESQSILFLL